jgi:hypothetical protein
MSKRIRGGSWLATREISFKMCWFIPNNFCMKIWKTRNSTAKWWSTHFRGVVIARQWLGVMASCHLQSQPCTYVLTNQATIITMHTNRCYPFYSNIGHVFVGTRWSENWLCKKKHTWNLDGAINYTRCPVFLFCSTHVNRCLWFLFLFLTELDK